MPRKKRLPPDGNRTEAGFHFDGQGKDSAVQRSEMQSRGVWRGLEQQRQNKALRLLREDAASAFPTLNAAPPPAPLPEHMSLAGARAEIDSFFD